VPCPTVGALLNDEYDENDGMPKPLNNPPPTATLAWPPAEDDNDAADDEDTLPNGDALEGKGKRVCPLSDDDNDDGVADRGDSASSCSEAADEDGLNVGASRDKPDAEGKPCELNECMLLPPPALLDGVPAAVGAYELACSWNAC